MTEYKERGHRMSKVERVPFWIRGSQQVEKQHLGISKSCATESLFRISQKTEQQEAQEPGSKHTGERMRLSPELPLKHFQPDFRFPRWRSHNQCCFSRGNCSESVLCDQGALCQKVPHVKPLVEEEVKLPVFALMSQSCRFPDAVVCLTLPIAQMSSKVSLLPQFPGEKTLLFSCYLNVKTSFTNSCIVCDSLT